MLKKIASLVRRPIEKRARFRMFRAARVWSNRELEKFAPMFGGKVVNVSAWEDKDKEGRTYKDYFTSSSDYFITNFGTDQGVVQGQDNEYFLDLEADLPTEMAGRFDVVFNHTVLEHVYDFRKAFSNLCDLSSDVVIIVVPWMQALHANYGDYWRFSPQAVVRMFEDNGFSTVYLSWTEKPRTSVYVFAIGTRHPEKWSAIGTPTSSGGDDFHELPVNFAGKDAI